MSDVASATDIDSVLSQLPAIIGEVGHNEIWGIDLSAASPPCRLIAGKYLRAHQGNVQAANDALKATLAWRKEFNPTAAAFNESHDAKFETLGYITTLTDGSVITWNVYGAAAHDPLSLFTPLDQFLRWRVGLQERSIAALQLDQYTGDGIEDTKQGQQIHDYDNVSFFRMDPSAKAGSKATIDLLAKHYPETMKRKFFVNVPVIMGWVFSAMRLFVSAQTVAKFTVVSYGSQLVHEVGHEDEIPQAYGGKSTLLLADLARKHPVDAPNLPKHNDTDKNAEAVGKSAAATIDEIKATGDHDALPPSVR